MIHNVHQREYLTGEARLGELLDGVAEPGGIWPPGWPPLRLDRPLAVGADGGHGPIRYYVERYEPGRRVVFRFHPVTGMDGTHGFEVAPGSRADTAVLRHVLSCRPLGPAAWLRWALAIRWLHDTVLEEILDRAGRAVGDPPTVPARRSVWVRVCRRLIGAELHATASG